MTGATLERPPPLRAPERAQPVGLVALVLAPAVGVLGFRLGAGTDAVAAAVAAAAALIAGCPIAVALAATAIRPAGARRAARLGLAPDVAEQVALGRVGPVLLRRTGTLTTGVGELRAVTVTGGTTADDVLRLAAAVERPCAHVLARAIVAAAGTEVPDVADYDRVPGRGVRGVVAELSGAGVVAHAVVAGNSAFLLDHGIALPPDLAAAHDTAAAAGRTAVAVAWDGIARGVLDVDDPVRPEAAAALAALRRIGVRPTLVTGAASAVAAAVAERIGFAADEVFVGPAHPLRTASDLVTAVDAARLAHRVRCAAATARAATAGVAGAGAVAAAVGLLDPATALVVPAGGLIVVACARLVVVTVRSWGAVGHPADRTR